MRLRSFGMESAIGQKLLIFVRDHVIALCLDGLYDKGFVLSGKVASQILGDRKSEKSALAPPSAKATWRALSREAQS
jgi:hypothetical protein